MNGRVALAALGAVALALSLASCGLPGPLPSVTAPATVSPTAPAPAPSEPTPTSSGQATAPDAALQPGECVPLDEAPDGVYAVFGAGSATVVRDGERLEVRSIDAAEGWTTRVEEEDAGNVEIEFRRDAVDYDLDVEIDDGRFEASVCRDDD